MEDRGAQFQLVQLCFGILDRQYFEGSFGHSTGCVEAFITKEIKDGAHGKHNIE